MTDLKQKVFKFVGGRILKTGLAAFLTALICDAFGLPVLFAVITAIVTVEPTASDSIKKGIIRFPAAAIGAGFAMVFESFLHQSPLTYALAATFTLIACHKLGLDDGMLVATLTAVAMIPDTTGDYMSSFVVRLSTTLIGIFVSTAVNYFVMPPKFHTMINDGVERLYHNSGDLLDQIIADLPHARRQTIVYQRLSRDLERTFKLISYQREEWKYRRHSMNEVRSFSVVLKKLEYLQKILYHLGNMLFTDTKNGIDEEHHNIIMEAGRSISKAFHNPSNQLTQKHLTSIEKLDQLFHDLDDSRTEVVEPRHHFTGKMIIIFELLSLNDVIDDLYILEQKEDRYVKRSAKHDTEI
ncbi:aromatic acid exporter family protein [Pseudalkalibacillus hwajinpoensis]|uniref:FUSC family protein n=1 Tax=Guptibacillus hwajinpoensis TaxID=208199 RepID=UPI00325A5ABC